MKTPEELAQEYVSRETTGSETYEHGLHNGFLAGYQAALDHIAAVGKMVPTNNDQSHLRYTFVKDHPKR